MFDLLFENIRRSDEIESKLLSIFEEKNWEYIAEALYQVLDNFDVSNDECKERVEVFCNTVRRLHTKKNQYISPYAAKINECVCHIYDMDDDELLEFYENTILNSEHYTSAGAQKQLPLDKAEVEEEIVKRRLQKEARLNEGLADHARRELELAGMFDTDVDGSEAMGSWNNLCAEAVLELMEVFAGQGHSGFSASMTQELFSRLAKYEKLTELTDSIDEWQEVTDNDPAAPGKFLHQSRRSPSCFSNDKGKTYWDIDEDWNKHEDEDGSVWSGGLSGEEWKNRPMHQSKH